MPNIQSKSLVARAEGQLVKTFGFDRPSLDHLYLRILICHKQMELRLPIGENLLHPMAQLLNNRTDTFYPLSDHSVFFTMLASFTEAWGSLLGSLDKNRPSSYF